MPRKLIENDLQPKSAQDALIEFRADLLNAFSSTPEGWALDLGLGINGEIGVTKFPIAVVAEGFTRSTGRRMFADSDSKTIEVVPEDFERSVGDQLSKLKKTNFLGWDRQPEIMARQAKQHPQKIVTALVEANGVSPVDGKNLFDVSRSFDPNRARNDWKNLYTSVPLDSTGIETATKHFSKLKDPAGDPLGLELTHIVVHPDDEWAAKKLLVQNWFPQAGGSTDVAVDNLYRGVAKPVVAKGLTTSDYWYGIASGFGMWPWIIKLVNGGKLEVIMHEEGGPLYQLEGKIGLTAILRLGAAIGMPHCIVRFKKGA